MAVLARDAQAAPKVSRSSNHCHRRYGTHTHEHMENSDRSGGIRVLRVYFRYRRVPKSCFVTSACARRTGAAARVERRRRER